MSAFFLVSFFGIFDQINFSQLQIIPFYFDINAPLAETSAFLIATITVAWRMKYCCFKVF